MRISFNTPALRFVRHYVEMVVAMMAGMLLLVPFGAVVALIGSSMGALEESAPAVVLVAMAASMTGPMVGWMLYRGHSRRATAEMAGAMIVPTLGVLALLATGAMTDFGALMMLEHVVMFPAMLGVMLLRVDEYTHDHAAHVASA